MTGTALVHVGVRASDLQRTILFWRDALGLRVVNTDAGVYDLTDGTHNFRVFQHRGPGRPLHVSDLLDYLHIGVVVDDLQSVAERCNVLGFPPIYEGVNSDRPYDPAHSPSDAFKVKDPDGIVVDVAASRTQWPGIS